MKLSKNPIITIVLVLISVHLYRDVLAQCNHRITITNVDADKKKADGQFDLKVVSGGSFKGQLIRIEGTNESTIGSFSGSGAKSFTFSQLNFSREIFYRVGIEFEGEEKLLCKRQVKDIVITDIPSNHV
jgi:hypothetical protein